jgi:DNA repair protein RadC
MSRGIKIRDKTVLGKDVLAAIGPDGSFSITNKELAARLLEEFGGVGGLAKHVHEEFNAAAKGGMIRRCILADIQQLINRADDGEEETPLEQMTTEDIENELNNRLGKIKKAQSA